LVEFSILTHFENIRRGVIDSRDLLYYVSLIFYPLFVTGMLLKNHRAG
jgi:ABC-2 type transport system permease protein